MTAPVLDEVRRADGLRIVLVILMTLVVGMIVTTLYKSAKQRHQRMMQMAMLRLLMRGKLAHWFLEVRRLRKFSRLVLELPGTEPAQARLISIGRCRAITEQLRDVSQALTDIAQGAALECDKVLPEQQRVGIRSISLMKEYVDAIIEELASHEEFPFPLRKSPRLLDLLGEYRHSRYRSAFVRPFHRANSHFANPFF